MATVRTGSPMVKRSQTTVIGVRSRNASLVTMNEAPQTTTAARAFR